MSYQVSIRKKAIQALKKIYEPDYSKIKNCHHKPGR